MHIYIYMYIISPIAVRILLPYAETLPDPPGALFVTSCYVTSCYSFFCFLISLQAQMEADRVMRRQRERNALDHEDRQRKQRAAARQQREAEDEAGRKATDPRAAAAAPAAAAPAAAPAPAPHWAAWVFMDGETARLGVLCVVLCISVSSLLEG